jgi:hypothetical protein
MKCIYTRGGQANLFLKVRNLQIRKFLGSFRYRKSITSLGCASSQIENPQMFMINP